MPLTAWLVALHEKDRATVKGVKYDQVSLLLINAVKDQQTQIQKLLKSNRVTQRINQGLRPCLNRLEQQVKTQRR